MSSSITKKRVRDGSSDDPSVEPVMKAAAAEAEAEAEAEAFHTDPHADTYPGLATEPNADANATLKPFKSAAITLTTSIGGLLDPELGADDSAVDTPLPSLRPPSVTGAPTSPSFGRGKVTSFPIPSLSSPGANGSLEPRQGTPTGLFAAAGGAAAASAARGESAATVGLGPGSTLGRNEASGDRANAAAARSLALTPTAVTVHLPGFSSAENSSAPELSDDGEPAALGEGDSPVGASPDGHDEPIDPDAAELSESGSLEGDEVVDGEVVGWRKKKRRSLASNASGLAEEDTRIREQESEVLLQAGPVIPAADADADADADVDQDPDPLSSRDLDAEESTAGDTCEGSRAAAPQRLHGPAAGKRMRRGGAGSSSRGGPVESLYAVVEPNSDADTPSASTRSPAAKPPIDKRTRRTKRSQGVKRQYPSPARSFGSDHEGLEHVMSAGTSHPPVGIAGAADAAKSSAFDGTHTSSGVGAGVGAGAGRSTGVHADFVLGAGTGPGTCHAAGSGRAPAGVSASLSRGYDSEGAVQDDPEARANLDAEWEEWLRRSAELSGNGESISRDPPDMSMPVIASEGADGDAPSAASFGGHEAAGLALNDGDDGGEVKDAPLLPLRPPSVSGSAQPLTFGRGSMFGLPIPSSASVTSPQGAKSANDTDAPERPSSCPPRVVDAPRPGDPPLLGFASPRPSGSPSAAEVGAGAGAGTGTGQGAEGTGEGEERTGANVETDAPHGAAGDGAHGLASASCAADMEGSGPPQLSPAAGKVDAGSEL